MTEQPHGSAGDLDGVPDPKAVAKRAEESLPEEATSDDPLAQAQAVLEASETRMAAGAAEKDRSG